MSASFGVRLVHYFSGGLLSALLGLVSFSVLTRNLSVEDYGILGLATSTIAIFVAIGKLGLQHGIIRFYAEQSIKAVFSTRILKLFLILSLSTAVLWWVSFLVWQLPPFSVGREALFGIAALSVFARLYASAYINLLKAQQNSASVLWAQSIEKLARFALILLLMALGFLDALGAMAAAVISELMALYYLHKPFRRCEPHGEYEAYRLPVKAMLIFSLPMMLKESLGLLLEVGDRYVIEHFLGSYWLGQYAVPYNLALYLDWVAITALSSAVIPQYVALWESQKKSETSSFVQRGLGLYLVFGVGVWGGFVLQGPTLIEILAGDRYHMGHQVLGWVVAGILIQGMTLFTGAGLYLTKRSQHFMWWNMAAGILNVLLNWHLVPEYGIEAAAVTTLVSYAIGTAGVTWSAQKHFKLQWPTQSLLSAIVALLPAYWVAGQISLSSPIATVLLSGGIYCGLFLLFSAWLHREVREILSHFGQKVRQKWH